MDIIPEQLRYNSEFKSLSPQEQTEVIEYFAERQPESTKAVYLDNANKVMEEMSRESGVGRVYVENKVMDSLKSVLPTGYNDLDKDSKLAAIDKALPILEQRAAEIDPVNKNDTAFYARRQLTQEMRSILGEDVSEVGDKSKRFLGGVIQSIAAPFDEEGTREFLARNLPTKPEYDETNASVLTQAAGDFVGQIGMIMGAAAAITATGGTAGVAFAGSTALGLAQNSSRKFQENYNLAKADMGLSDDEALAAGMAGMPGAVIDSFGDALLLRGIKLGTVGKAFKSMTATEKAAEIVAKGGSILKDPKALRTFGANFIKGGLSEGVSESLGDAATAWGGYATSGHEGFKPSAESLWQSFWVGGLLGGTFNSIANTGKDMKNTRSLKELGKLDQAQFVALGEDAQNQIADLMDKENYTGALEVVKKFKSLVNQKPTATAPAASTATPAAASAASATATPIAPLVDAQGNPIELVDQKEKSDVDVAAEQILIEDGVAGTAKNLRVVPENQTIAGLKQSILSAVPNALNAVRAALQISPETAGQQLAGQKVTLGELTTAITSLQQEKSNATKAGKKQQNNKQQSKKASQGGQAAQTGDSDSAQQGEAPEAQAESLTPQQQLEAARNMSPEQAAEALASVRAKLADNQNLTPDQRAAKVKEGVATEGEASPSFIITPNEAVAAQEEINKLLAEIESSKQQIEEVKKNPAKKRAPKKAAKKAETKDATQEIQEEQVPDQVEPATDARGIVLKRIDNMLMLARYKSKIIPSFAPQLENVKTLADNLKSRVNNGDLMGILDVDADLDGFENVGEIISKKDVDEMISFLSDRLEIPSQQQAAQEAISNIQGAEQDGRLFQDDQGADLVSKNPKYKALSELNPKELEAALSIVKALQALGINDEVSDVDKVLAIEIKQGINSGSFSEELISKLNEAAPSRAIFQNQLYNLKGFGKTTKDTIMKHFDVMALNFLKTGNSLQAFWARVPDIAVVDAVKGSQTARGALITQGLGGRVVEDQGGLNTGNLVADVGVNENQAIVDIPFSPVPNRIVLVRGKYNASTMMHENDHNMIVTGTVQQVVEAQEGGVELYDEVLTEIGAKRGEAWTVAQHEKWVRAREAWINGGEVKSVFTRVFNALKTIFTNLYTSGALAKHRNPVLEKAFVKIYDIDTAPVEDIKAKVSRETGYEASKLLAHVPATKLEHAQRIMEAVKLNPDLGAAKAELIVLATTIQGDAQVFTDDEVFAMLGVLEQVYTGKQAPLGLPLYDEVNNHFDSVKGITPTQIQNESIQSSIQDEIPTSNAGETQYLNTVVQSDPIVIQDDSKQSESGQKYEIAIAASKPEMSNEMREAIIQKMRGLSPNQAPIQAFYELSTQEPVVFTEPETGVTVIDVTESTIVDSDGSQVSVRANETIAAQANKTLSDASKKAYASFVGAVNWTSEVASKFAKDFADFVMGAKFPSSISDIFSRFMVSMKSTLIAGASFFSMTNFVGQELTLSEPVVTQTEKAEVKKFSVINPTSIKDSTYIDSLIDIYAAPQAPRYDEKVDSISVHDEIKNDAQIVDEFVRQTGDNEGKPYIIVSKREGIIRLYDASGNLVHKSTVLLGKSYGDVVTNRNRTMAQTRANDSLKITPSGRYETKTSKSRNYGEVVGLESYNTGTRNAIHRVCTKFVNQKRLERLAGDLSNRISLGCINVYNSTSTKVNELMRDGGVVYVTPDNQLTEEFVEGIRESRPQQSGSLYQDSSMETVVTRGGTAGVIVEYGNKRLIALSDQLSNDVTELHEAAHEFEAALTNKEKSEIAEWAGHKSYTNETSEEFARGFESYMSGSTATPKIESLFQKFAKWLANFFSSKKAKRKAMLNDSINNLYGMMISNASLYEGITTNNAPSNVTPEVQARIDSTIKSIRAEIARRQGVPLERYEEATSRVILPNLFDSDKELIAQLQEYAEIDAEITSIKRSNVAAIDKRFGEFDPSMKAELIELDPSKNKLDALHMTKLLFVSGQPNRDDFESMKNDYNSYNEHKKKNNVDKDKRAFNSFKTFRDFSEYVHGLDAKFGEVIVKVAADQKQETEEVWYAPYFGNAVPKKNITFQNEDVVIARANTHAEARAIGGKVGLVGNGWCTTWSQPTYWNQYRLGSSPETMYFAFFPKRIAADPADPFNAIHFGIDEDLDISFSDRNNYSDTDMPLSELVNGYEGVPAFPELNGVDFDQAFPLLPPTEAEIKISKFSSWSPFTIEDWNGFNKEERSLASATGIQANPEIIKDMTDEEKMVYVESVDKISPEEFDALGKQSIKNRAIKNITIGETRLTDNSYDIYQGLQQEKINEIIISFYDSSFEGDRQPFLPDGLLNRLPEFYSDDRYVISKNQITKYDGNKTYVSKDISFDVNTIEIDNLPRESSLRISTGQNLKGKKISGDVKVVQSYQNGTIEIDSLIGRVDLSENASPKVSIKNHSGTIIVNEGNPEISIDENSGLVMMFETYGTDKKEGSLVRLNINNHVSGSLSIESANAIVKTNRLNLSFGEINLKTDGINYTVNDFEDGKINIRGSSNVEVLNLYGGDITVEPLSSNATIEIRGANSGSIELNGNKTNVNIVDLTGASIRTKVGETGSIISVDNFHSGIIGTRGSDASVIVDRATASVYVSGPTPNMQIYGSGNSIEVNEANYGRLYYDGRKSNPTIKNKSEAAFFQMYDTSDRSASIPPLPDVMDDLRTIPQQQPFYDEDGFELLQDSSMETVAQRDIIQDAINPRPTMKKIYRGGSLRGGAALNYFTSVKSYAEQSYGQSGVLIEEQIDDSSVLDLTGLDSEKISTSNFAKVLRDAGVKVTSDDFMDLSRSPAWVHLQAVNINHEMLAKKMKDAGYSGIKWIEWGPPSGEFGANIKAEAYLIPPSKTNVLFQDQEASGYSDSAIRSIIGMGHSMLQMSARLGTKIENNKIQKQINTLVNSQNNRSGKPVKGSTVQKAASALLKSFQEFHGNLGEVDQDLLVQLAYEKSFAIEDAGLDADSLARRNNIRKRKGQPIEEEQRVAVQDKIKKLYNTFRNARTNSFFKNNMKSQISPEFRALADRILSLVNRGLDNVMGAFNSTNEDLLLRFADNIEAYNKKPYEGTPEFIEQFNQTVTEVEEEVMEHLVRQYYAYNSAYVDAEGISEEINGLVAQLQRMPEEGAMEWYERMVKIINQIEAAMFTIEAEGNPDGQSDKDKAAAKSRAKRESIAKTHQAALLEKFPTVEDFIAYKREQDGGVLTQEFEDILRDNYTELSEAQIEDLSNSDLKVFNSTALTIIVGGSNTQFLTPTKRKWRENKVASWHALVESMTDRVGDSPLVRSIYRSASRSNFLERQLNNFDKVFQANVENFHVWIDRFSQYAPVRNWFDRQFFADFQANVFVQAENARKAAETWSQETIESYNDDVDNTVDANPYLWVMSMLSQYNLGEDPNKGFSKAVTRARTSIQRTIDQNRSARLVSEANRNLVALNYMLEGINIEADNSHDLFMNNATVGNRIGAGNEAKANKRLELLSNITSYFQQDIANQKFIRENIFGKPFQTVVNYLPLKALKVDGSLDEWDWTSIEPKAEYQVAAQNVNARSNEERVDDLGQDRAYGMDFFNMVERKAVKNALDKHAILPVAILSDIFKTEEKVIDGVPYRVPKDNAIKTIFGSQPEVVNQLSIIKEKITHQMVQIYGATEPATGFVGGLKKVLGLIQGSMLSGGGQIVQQSSAAVVDYCAREKSNIGYMIDAMIYWSKNYNKYRDWLLKNNTDLYERGNTQGIREFERHVNNAGSELNSMLDKGWQGIDQIRKFMTISLRYGDKIGAELIFLAEHMKAVKQSGQMPTNGDYDIDNYSNPYYTAQAQGQLAKFVGPSSAAGRSYWMSDHKQHYFLLRSLTGSFQSSAHNMSSQMLAAARNIVALQSDKSPEGRAERIAEYRKIGSIMAQQATFTGVRHIVGAMMVYALAGAIKDAWDDEDGAIEEAQLELEEARNKYYPSKAAKDMAVTMAERKLADAKSIRKSVIFMKQQASGDSLMKSMVRDQLQNLHIVGSVGDGFAPKIFMMVPNSMAEQSHKEAQDLIVGNLKKEKSEALAMGDRRKAAKIGESIVNAQAVQYIPYFYDKKDKSGFGGIVGGMLDPVFTSVKEGVEDMTRADKDFLTARAFVPDMITYMAALGLGQADVNRIARQLQRMDDELSKNRDSANERAGKEVDKLTNKPKTPFLR